MGTTKADVLIVGGGPAGSATAMRLLERGVTPLVVEREQFPRYHIGESMTGECGAVVRELGLGDRMAAAGHPVKHGVITYGARGAPDWFLPVMQRLPDGELRDQTTWQVRRSVFDTMMLDEAVSRGADLLHGRATAPLVDDDGCVRGATVRAADGREVTVEAEITLDCSGQATFLANRKATGPKYLGAYDKQIAIFSQVAGFERAGGGGGRQGEPGNTHIFYKRKYHWAWAIPIDDDVTSVGVVVPARYFNDSGESREQFLRRELRELNPGLSERVTSTDLVEPAHVVPNYSFQVRRFAGPGYICVGDAHRFLDPIFSFGLYVALKESGFAADAAVGWLEGEGRGSPEPFHDHMVAVEAGVDVLEDMIDTFWENPIAFAVFTYGRYRGAMIDCFAGRIFEGMPNEGLDRTMGAFHKLLKRRRTYDRDGLYSVPIGSRYHPERAPLWNSELDSVATTERWMRDEG